MDEVLFGRLEKGGHVDVTLNKEGKIEFLFEEKRHEKPGEKAGGEKEEAKESSKT